MKFICDGLELCDATLKVSKAISQKVANPVLEGIRLSCDDQTLIVSATDLEIGIEKRIKADILKDGEVIVPGKLFAELCKKMTNEKIEITVSDEKVEIKYLDTVGYIQCLKSSEYPSFKDVDEDSYFSLKQKDLKAVIERSIFAVASDESRPILRGILFEANNKELKAVALDGFRLAVAKTNITASTGNFRMVVPARCLQEISKSLTDSDEEIKCFIKENYMQVSPDNTKILTRLMQGEYINYEQILPTAFQTEIVLNKRQFEESLERAVLLSKIGQNNLVKFNIGDSLLNITSNSEVGNISENVTISKTGPDLLIAFNAQYFLESLKACSDEFVKVLFNKSVHPCEIVPCDGNSYIYLILPVRML